LAKEFLRQRSGKEQPFVINYKKSITGWTEQKQLSSTLSKKKLGIETNNHQGGRMKSQYSFKKNCGYLAILLSNPWPRQ